MQKQHLADYLKRNYLGGGNSRFLLQNKLLSIEKIGGLVQCKNNLEKLLGVLTSLVNTMQDLSALAKNHDLEGQLYEGGGLEKVISLLGEARHRRFRVENLTADLTKKQEWQKLQEFLGKELKLTEKLILDRKSANLLGIQAGQTKLLAKRLSNKF